MLQGAALVDGVRMKSMDGLVRRATSLESERWDVDDARGVHNDLASLGGGRQCVDMDGRGGVKERTCMPGEERTRLWKIYGLHFLFVWNTRGYEFASIILVSLAFPGSLTAASIRGITSTLSTLLFASSIGSLIDRSSTRLRPLLASIITNHAALLLSYVLWLLFPFPSATSNPSKSSSFFTLKTLLFAVILVIDIVQDLSAVANKLSLERDCVPVLVESHRLTDVNAVLSRLDLLCKLVAPSLLPLVIKKEGESQKGWVMILICTTIILLVFELCIARLIAQENPQLQTLRPLRPETGSKEPRTNFLPRRIWRMLYFSPMARLKAYFSFQIWPASFCIAIFQITVLAYSSTLITYLLDIGFSIDTVAVARASGSVLALLSTVGTPLLMRYLRRRQTAKEAHDGVASRLHGFSGKIIRLVGLWSVSSQLICTIPVVILLWHLSPDPSSSPSPHLLLPITLFAFLSLSRIGHAAFDLMVQELEQTELPASQRASFAGMEQSLNSLGSLVHWGATVVWNRPEEFRWLAVGSCGFLAGGTAIFAWWSMKPEGVLEGEREEEYEEVALEDVGT